MMNETEMARVVRRAIDGYFRDLDGEKASGVYDMVIGSVEKSLIADVLTRAKGNQSEAASMLGINRNTLRAKLDKYKLKAI